MNRNLLLGCVVALTLAMAPRAVAQETAAPKFEFKAVSFDGQNSDSATKLLNELQDGGWEYVGPLANGLVSFRRVVASAGEIAAKKDRDRLQGTWTTVSTEIGGDQRLEDRKSEKITITGNKWTIKMDGEVAQEGTLKIVDTGVKLIKVDFLVAEGNKQGDTWISVIQIDGEKMKWCGCYLSDGRARPKGITTREDDGYFLRTLKRDPPK